MDATRRMFLGGAISLLAVKTFVPSVQAQKNLPQIWGDGRHDDTSGLGSLFRREPVWFAPDKIGVDEHGGIIFHNGIFKVTQTIEIPDDVLVKVEQVSIDLYDLDRDLYAFRGHAKALEPFTGLFTSWKTYKPRVPAYYEGEAVVRPAREVRGVFDRRLFMETTYAFGTEDYLV